MNDLNDPKCKRFFRNCDEFSLCVNIGESGYVISEHPNERYTIFYYGVYGSGKFGRIFDPNPITLDANKKEIADVQDYVNDRVSFASDSDFFLIGFNTLDKDVKWAYKIITSNDDDFVFGSKKTFIVCLDGNPIVNNKKLKRYDYSQIYSNKEYNLNMNDNGVLGIFYIL